MISENTTENIYAGDIVVIAGTRPAGRRFSRMEKGRTKHGLLYLRSGTASLTPDRGEALIATAGQLLYLPAGIKYRLQYTAPSTEFVVVNFSLFRDDGQPLSLHEGITVLPQADAGHAVAGIMGKLAQCGTVQNLAGQLRRKELLFRLLAILYSDSESVSRLQPQIEKGVLLLKQTYLENLPMETFARHSGISQSAFRQLFHKQYGMSPLQYRNRLRIRRARELLEYEHCTVAEAAYGSGFENIGYFCRYYKKITGQTPKQSRQNDP